MQTTVIEQQKNNLKIGKKKEKCPFSGKALWTIIMHYTAHIDVTF